MRLSELTVDRVLSHVRADDTSENRAYLEDIALPAAKSFVSAYTGRELEDLDQYEDITIAVLCLIADMFDVRAYTMNGIQKNPTVEQILGSHCSNFI